MTAVVSGVTAVAEVVEVGYALFLATAILAFVGAFLLIMTARLGERLIEYHLA
ncbi:hypothetical protein [Halorubrum aethiopicum]|uniref:hypothetical protein n=1 Tax=Halorubrum aethiopicum TaxID=1758255 RepID=UPI000AA09F54|nr:hypothetical protein [Halorubrum aethiopicum]